MKSILESSSAMPMEERNQFLAEQWRSLTEGEREHFNERARNEAIFSSKELANKIVKKLKKYVRIYTSMTYLCFYSLKHAAFMIKILY